LGGIAKFDSYSENYQDILDEHVKLAGEGSEYFAAYKAKYLAAKVGVDFAGKILDFGCGVGMLARLIKKHLPLAAIDGYDISSESLKLVGAELAGQGRFTSNEDELSRDYSVIVAANVFHHLPPESREATIKKLKERLKSSGRLMIFEHNPANPLTRRVVDSCPFDDDAVLLPAPEGRAYMKKADLEVVGPDYIVFFPGFLSFLRRWEPYLYRLPLGAQYVITGIKDE